MRRVFYNLLMPVFILIALITRGQEGDCPKIRVGVTLEEIHEEVYDELEKDYPAMSVEECMAQIDAWVVNEFLLFP